MTTDAISWFEIPVRDLDRAQRFYETVLERKLERETMGERAAGDLPGRRRPRAGLHQHRPAAGVAVDFGHARVPRLHRRRSTPRCRAWPTPAARWSMRKTALPSGMGYWAHMTDTEGNVVGLHAMN